MNAASVKMSTVVRRAALCGALAGFVVGVFELLARWRLIGHFAPTVSKRIASLFHNGSLYGMFSAGAAALAAIVAAGIWRYTHLGVLGRHAWAAMKTENCRPWILAFMLVFLPLAAIGLGVTYQISLDVLRHRHHRGLIVAVIIALGLGVPGLCGVLALILVRPVKRILAWLGARRGWRWLAHRRLPAIALVGLLGLGSAAVLYWGRETAAQLPLRPWAVGMTIGLLCGLLYRLGARISAVHLRRFRSWALPVATIALLVLALLTGVDSGVRKVVGAYAGLGAKFSQILRRAGDFDRDGYSTILGGGDCNDWDATIHPGAREIIGDGIDQNCIGGDPKISSIRGAPRFSQPPSTIAKNANIILITVDALRADHLEAYGYSRATSPNISALADRGALFLNAWAHSPSTRFSVPAILTGRYPSRITWDTSIWWPGLSPENTTIAEILRRRGFFNGALLNYRYFNPKRQMNQGFDIYRNHNARLHQGPDPASTGGSSAREQVTDAIRFVDAHRSRKFFLWMHLYDPHFRYERHPGTHDFGNRPVDLYDHEIRYTDDQLGRLFRHLRARDLDSRTIVVLTADHGEGFGEHGIRLHGYHLYSPQTKVPLIIRVPGLAPQRIRTPVAHIDLLPTLANLAAAPPSEAMLGRSLVDLLQDKPATDKDRRIFQEVNFEGPTERRAVVTQKWHLIYNARPDNSYELYNLERDPHERHDLWGQVSVDKLHVDLTRWIDTMHLKVGALKKLKQARLARRPHPAFPLAITLSEKGDTALSEAGGAIQLVGFDIERDGGQAHLCMKKRPMRRPDKSSIPSENREKDDLRKMNYLVQRGCSLILSSYFEVQRSPAKDWKIFIHLEGPGRRILADHDPVGGLLPTSRWKKGSFIKDTQSITIPRDAPPGNYAVYFGFFRDSTRLSIWDPAGQKSVGSRIRALTLRVRP